MTFRAAGTSLSGQAVSDGILVEVARHWRGIQVLEGGARVKVQPGVIGAHVNHALSLYRAKMGPDPASINTCTVGGILSNNSSGMCCGVVAERLPHPGFPHLRAALGHGHRYRRARTRTRRFRRQEPALAQGLLDLKREIESNPALAARIRAKYQHQEHHRLLPQRLPGFRPAGGHLPQPAGGLRRHPGLHRRGGAAHGARPAGEGHRLPPVPGHPCGLRRHRAPAGRRRRGPGIAGSGVPALGGEPAGHPATHQEPARGRGGAAGGVPGHRRRPAARTWNAGPWAPARP